MADTGMTLALIKALGGADPAAIQSSVDAWLEDHPEATTTVQDGAVSYAKLDNNLQGAVDDVGDLKSAVTALDNAVEQLESGSLSALGASEGQVPVADGEGEWAWGDAGGGGTVTDVQVNGVSVLDDGVANVPVGGSTVLGVVKDSVDYGTSISSATGVMRTYPATDDNIKAGSHGYRPIVPTTQHKSTFYGLAKAAGDSTQSASANAVGTYTDAAKSAISTMLNGSVSVSGTTPNITALPGIRYICGEVATLDITIPASGIVDVVFESGSTATVLTVTPPSGMTMKWIGEDPMNLEANKTYEVNIMDGCYGMVVSWT